MAEPLQYYMDEHIALAVTAGLRRRGVDVLTTQDADMLGADDSAQLSFAITQCRVMFTQDDDFLRLAATGIDHAGIVYAPQGTPIGVLVLKLMELYTFLDASDMLNHVEFL